MCARRPQYGLSTAKEAKQWVALELRHKEALQRMEELIDEPDMATGHAFIIFHKEVDRNKMYLLFLDPATRPRLQSEAWPRLPYKPPEKSRLPSCLRCCMSL